MSALPSADADLHGASVELYCCEVADWCTRPAHAVDLTSVAVTAELLFGTVFAWADASGSTVVGPGGDITTGRVHCTSWQLHHDDHRRGILLG
jgi:hypothetical protein